MACTFSFMRLSSKRKVPEVKGLTTANEGSESDETALRAKKERQRHCESIPPADHERERVSGRAYGTKLRSIRYCQLCFTTE